MSPVIYEIAERHGLTSRETDILHLLSQGMSNAEIAAELIISDGTAKIHVRSLLGKLPVKDRRDVAEWVKSHGAV
jgi:DNA-binding NarL/FixJ family response regulator